MQGGITFVKAISDIDTFLNVQQQQKQTGILTTTSTAFAALTFALGKIPVLGFFYKKIGQNIPGLIGCINAEIEEHYRMIDRMTQVH